MTAGDRVRLSAAGRAVTARRHHARLGTVLRRVDSRRDPLRWAVRWDGTRHPQLFWDGYLEDGS